MNKSLLLASVSLLGTFSVLASDRIDQQQQVNQSHRIDSSQASSSNRTNDDQGTGSPASQSQAPSNYFPLNNLPSEILGTIAQHTSEKDRHKLRNMVGDRLLTSKMQQPEFYQEYTQKVIEFDLKEPGSLGILKTLLLQVNSLEEDRSKKDPQHNPQRSNFV